jgi:hypothetical protein
MATHPQAEILGGRLWLGFEPGVFLSKRRIEKRGCRISSVPPFLFTASSWLPVKHGRAHEPWGLQMGRPCRPRDGKRDPLKNESFEEMFNDIRQC